MFFAWHSWMESNHQPAVLETAALPVELPEYETALGIEPPVATPTSALQIALGGI